MRWTEEEVEALKKNYSIIGAEGCTKLINRTSKAIRNKASLLGLKFPHGKPKRKVFEKLSETRVFALCPKHGKVLHYVNSKNARLICIECQKERDRKKVNIRTERRRRYEREYMRKRRKELKYLIENRLRASLHKYLKGKISFSKNLPYTREELLRHLQKIYKEQEGKCPMCGSSYEDVGFNIDHIIPLSFAKSDEEIIELYNLENLTLLCPHCNQHVKKNKLERNTRLLVRSKEVREGIPLAHV